MSPNETGRPSQFPLRLAKSLREAANAMALQQGVSLNHFISLALAEKISRETRDAAVTSNKNP
ncbi:MAG TPA: toxin-antitoxin system HicB family antitoxin [Acidobacteriaceae bacterium]|nr:toxin-antitoxin system HicB family antitoxin [Acidobacteriaceae bacterium]